MGRIEQNRGYVAMARTDDANETATPLIVDPVTDRLLIQVYPVETSTPVLNDGKIDQNFEKISEAVNDNIAAAIKPLLIDSRNGYLWVDILVEP